MRRGTGRCAKRSAANCAGVRLRRGPISFKKWGKEDQGERGSLPLDPCSLVLLSLGGCAFWRLVGLPLSHCPAVQKRAHRLGAPGVGRYPSRARTNAEGSSNPLAPPLGELSAKLTERAHTCLEGPSTQRAGASPRPTGIPPTPCRGGCVPLPNAGGPPEARLLGQAKKSAADCSAAPLLNAVGCWNQPSSWMSLASWMALSRAAGGASS